MSFVIFSLLSGPCSASGAFTDFLLHSHISQLTWQLPCTSDCRSVGHTHTQRCPRWQCKPPSWRLDQNESLTCQMLTAMHFMITCFQALCQIPYRNLPPPPSCLPSPVSFWKLWIFCFALVNWSSSERSLPAARDPASPWPSGILWRGGRWQDKTDNNLSRSRSYGVHICSTWHPASIHYSNINNPWYIFWFSCLFFYLLLSLNF